MAAPGLARNVVSVTGPATDWSSGHTPAYANHHLVLRNDEEIIRVSMDASDY